MDYFEKYSSNTCGASSNQLYFSTEGRVHTGRILYKISAGGEYNYSLLFSNIIDSTYSDGSIAHKNLICNSWMLHSVKIGRGKKLNSPNDIGKAVIADYGENKSADYVVGDFKEISFNSKSSKLVMPGEFFYSDAINLDFKKDEYMCVEISYSGDMIPYHEEILLPLFVKNEKDWSYSKHMPVPAMIGCDRSVRARVGYLGDSITQGIGPKADSYLNWSAVLSDMLGSEYSFWNLGIGFGRANDVASGGSWLYKAKQCDIVFLCFGVNDIFRLNSAEQTKNDLAFIVDALKKNGIKIILQTVPPFDYDDKTIGIWEEINSFIKTQLAENVDFVFDNIPVLGVLGSEHNAEYGGHPNEEGSALLAKALYNSVMPLFK